METNKITMETRETGTKYTGPEPYVKQDKQNTKSNQIQDTGKS